MHAGLSLSSWSSFEELMTDTSEKTESNQSEDKFQPKISFDRRNTYL